jgi:5-carboxymethyl-2-hydroxymuconate isomerase
MPHCILEASDNLPDPPDWGDLLAELHGTLTGTGLFREADLKSRVIRHGVFRVADGAPDRGFVALEMQVLEGRDEATKARISEALMEVLERAFARTAAGIRLNLTVQVSDLHRASYRRTNLPEAP